MLVVVVVLGLLAVKKSTTSTTTTTTASNLDPLPDPSHAIRTVQATEPHLVVTSDERLQLQPRFERLVELANLNLDDLAAAHASAANIDFRNTNNLMAHGDGVPPKGASCDLRTNGETLEVAQVDRKTLAQCNRACV